MTECLVPAKEKPEVKQNYFPLLAQESSPE